MYTEITKADYKGRNRTDIRDRTVGFKHLVRKFVRDFSSSTGNIESILNDALGKIAGFLEFDTVAQLHIYNHLSVTDSTWVGQHVLERGEAFATFECPWTLSRIAQGNVVNVTDLSALPSHADRDYIFCGYFGVQSFYGIPLYGKEGLIGGLVIGTSEPERILSRQSIDHVQVLGEILANGMMHAEREEQREDAIEAAEMGLWSLDFSTMTFWATETARTMHGFGPTVEISIENLLEVVYPDDRALVRETIEKAIRETQQIRIEYRVILPNSVPRWLVIRGRSYRNTIGKIQQFMGVCTDYSDQKHAEQELRNAKALTDAVFDSVPGLLYLYTKDGRLIRWNKQHEKMTGYSAEELYHFPVKNWFRKIDHPTLQREWSKVFNQGYTTVNLKLKLKDGTLAPYSFTGVRVDIGGEAHLVGIGVDMTENNRVEKTLAQFRAELARASRVTTLGELASALAHELNQPLAAILSNAQAASRLLANEPPDLDEVREALVDIVRDDKRAGNIIHGLRGLMSKEKGKPTRLNLNNIIHGMTDIIHGELVLSEVPLTLDLAPTLPTVGIGQTEVQQLLLNLILNGIAAQRLTDPDKRQLTVATIYDNKNVIVTVRDHGTGIPDDEMPRLFEPFFSTKEGGLGMGLPICRRIAEAYQGKVWAENNVDRGATFYLSLPIAGSNV